MASLYIDRRDARLDIQGGQLRIHEPGSKPQGFPLASLERIVVSSNVALESKLITQLVEQGTSILFIDGRGARRFAHIAGSRHGDVARRLGQYRLCSSNQECLRWAKLVVRRRAAGCIHLLHRALAQRPDNRLSITAALRTITALSSRIRVSGDLAALRGLEGAIGAAHFRAYTTLFPDSVNFHARNRRPPRDPVNAALSLGFTLSHVEAARQCHIAGLDPLLGLYHQPAHSRESLACDLNELVRHRVEQLVWRMFAEKRLRPENFENHTGGVFLKKEARWAFYSDFENDGESRRRMLRQAATVLARACSRNAPAVDAPNVD